MEEGLQTLEQALFGLGNTTAGEEQAENIASALTLLKLLRLLRLLKLGRHYEGSIVLFSALKRSTVALMVPVFFLFVMVAIFAGLIFFFEGPTSVPGAEEFDNMFKASWFVLVTLTTVGYGDITPITPGGKLVASAAIMCGVLFMAMPITIVGNSFAVVWEEREALQVVLRVQELLMERGLHTHEVILVFKEFDDSGDGQLDAEEFKHALSVLGVQLPPSKVRQLFRMFDSDASGSVSYQEFCNVVFPDLDDDLADEIWAKTERESEERRRSLDAGKSQDSLVSRASLDSQLSSEHACGSGRTLSCTEPFGEPNGLKNQNAQAAANAAARRARQNVYGTAYRHIEQYIIAKYGSC